MSPLTEAAIFEAIDKLKGAGVIVLNPTLMIVSPAAEAVAKHYGVTVEELFEAVQKHKER